MRRRQNAIEKLREFEAVETSLHLERPLKEFKKQARKSVSFRFSIFRRIAFIFGIGTIAVVAVFPFVDLLPQAFISIIVGSAAIITGMAARPFIENFLSGIAITASRMLNIGDTILLDDKYGTVEDISPTHTVLRLWDWRRYVIPNSSMINQEFINYTLNDTRVFAHIEFTVAYDSDIELVQKLALEAVTESEHYDPAEEPSFWIMETEKDSVKCWVATWAASPQMAWEVRADIRTRLIKKLRSQGVRTHLQQVNLNNSK